MNNNYLKHYNQALYLFTSENNEEKAIEEYKKSIKINPFYAQAYYDLGYVYSLRNEFKFAIEHYQAYLALKPYANDKSEITIVINRLKYKSEISNIIHRLETQQEKNYLYC